MSNLVELSRRVSEAEGPSRELDAEIARALGWAEILAECWEAPDGKRTLHSAPPTWTASLDAVAVMIAEKLPGWAWSAGVDHDVFLGAGEMPCSGTVMGNVREQQPAFDEPPEIAYDYHMRKAQTPALALLSAALLAIHERNKTDG